MTAPLPADANWLKGYAKIQQRADREVLALLKTALADIKKTIAAVESIPGSAGIGRQVRLEQMRRVRAAMLREQARIFEKTGDIVQARRLDAAARAAELGSAIDSAVFTAVGRGAQGQILADALTRGLKNTVELAVVRMTQSQFPLSERIYRTRVWMDGRVDKMINSALARGLTAKEFAKEAEDWFDPSTPGGVRYAAMRLARTEINNAFHAISINQAAEKPWVPAMKWNLSGSHPKADVCDEYANEDKFNIGAGMWPTREVPRKPHPHCFCYVVPRPIDEGDFLDGLVSGKYDDYLNRKRAAHGLPGLPARNPTAGMRVSPGLPGNTNPSPALSRRAAAKARQAAIDVARPIAETTAKVDQAIGTKAGDLSPSQMRQILDEADNERALGSGVGLGPDLRAELEKLLNDPVALRKALEAAAREAGLAPLSGRAGSIVEFDDEIMETLPGVHYPDNGVRAHVYRRGYSFDYQGEEIQMFKTIIYDLLES